MQVKSQVGKGTIFVINVKTWGQTTTALDLDVMDRSIGSLNQSNQFDQVPDQRSKLVFMTSQNGNPIENHFGEDEEAKRMCSRLDSIYGSQEVLLKQSIDQLMGLEKIILEQQQDQEEDNDEDEE